MSAGPISRGFNSLLGRLSNVGPQGPQGPGTAAAARPPVESIQPLPQRPSFFQRYQQDAFEDTPRRGGRGGGRGGGGGGLDLSGGQRDFGAPAQGQGEGKGQAKGTQASAAVDAAQGKKKQEPAQVLEFRKGKPARERDEFQTQPQKARGAQDAAQKPQGAQNDKDADQKKAQADKDAQQKKAKKPQKPTPKPATKPPEPELGSAFKKVMVAGEVKIVGRSMGERKQDAPAGKSEADAVAAAAANASQSS